MPFSMRQPAKSLKDLKFKNDFCAIPLYIGIFKDFKVAIRSMKKLFNGLKNSLDPFAVLYSFKLAINLPFVLPEILINILSSKNTMIFSNLNATTKRFVFAGK